MSLLLMLDRVSTVFFAQTGQPVDDPAAATDAAADQVGDASTQAADQPAADPIEDATDFISGFDRDQALDLAQQFGIPLAKAIIVFFIAAIVARWARRFIIKIATKSHVEITLAKFFGSLAKWAILLLAGLAVLGILGIETASFAVVLGALGFAVGMAMQGSLGNLAAGVMLLIFRPFKVEQVVNVSGVTGKVDEIGLFSTTVDTFDNRRFIVPNGSVFGSVIENISHHDTRRVDVGVGIDYGVAIDQSRDVLMKAAHSLDGILEDPGPSVTLGDLGDSSVNWTVRVWCNSPDYWDLKQALTRAVKMHLDDAGIGIPFPQMDVHLDKPA